MRGYIAESSLFLCCQLVLAVTCLGLNSVACAQQPATASTAPADVKTLLDDVKVVDQKLTRVMPPGTLSDEAKRRAAADEAIPLLKRMQSDLDGVVAAKPSAKPQVASGQQQLMAILATLGDKPSVAKVQSMADSLDPQLSVRGKAVQLLARWYQAGNTAPTQTSIIDDLEKLDRANPNDNGLTALTMEMSQSAATIQLRDRLQTLASDGMTSSAAASIKRQLAAEAAHQAQVKATLSKLLNQPMTITGTQPDGSQFTTAQYKGKVVLVDFWATWCGPCRAELPKVKQLYQQYHSQGLELVGISNDYDVDKLKLFVVQQQMPWPELFDADAAADQQWNRITMDFGIDTIPTMFLIDKNGTCRSVTARQEMETLIPKLLAEAN